MRLWIVLIFVITATGCKKPNARQDCEPDSCIQTKIEQFTSSVVCKSGAAVKEYNFRGKTVYVFDQTFCLADGWADVYDANCKYLGMLGGIAGLGKINGIAFYENASYVRTIWQN